MKKTIMIIGAGIMQIPLIETAKEMGLKTVVTDYNSDAVGLKLADIPLIISTRDFEGTVRVAKQYNKKSRIDGVLTVGTDASMTVAAVANALGLPGIKFESAEKATNKLKMRKSFTEYGAPSPKYFECWTLDDAKNSIKEIRLPAVIKPSDNMGARGVRKINEFSEIEEAFKNAKSESPSGEIIIEEYIDGDELSIDALIYNGKIMFTGIADRIIGLEPYFVELGHIMPSNKSDSEIEKAKQAMIKGIKALGLDFGGAKGDIKLTKNGAMIGEIAARLSGGFMSIFTYPYSTGCNLMESAIKVALGEDPGDLSYEHKRVAVEKAIIPKSGYIKSIKNIEKARKLRGVKNVFIHITEGQIFESPRNNLEKAGNVIVVGKTRKEALKIADDAVKSINIQIGVPPILNYRDLRLRAFDRFNGSCFTCEHCDGKQCTGLIPGMGSVGQGTSFKANIESFQNYKLNQRVIHNITEPDTSIELWKYKLDTPVLAAPITGTDVNMNCAMDELDYDIAVVKGSQQAGTIALLGDGAQPEQYQLGIKAIRVNEGWGIPIFKPRIDQSEIIKRIRAAEKAGAIAVGIDIDAACFITMKSANQSVGPKSKAELKKLVKSTKLPFIIKGIMSIEDAQIAVEIGASMIIVSNHGGRVMDGMPGTLDILPEITELLKGKIIIGVDGGIRSGSDVLKCMACGADVVMVGRPITIGAVGGGIEGVKFVYDKIKKELMEAMVLTGTENVSKVTSKILWRKT